MKILRKLKELTGYHFTLVIIPHTSAKVKKLSFSFNFMLFFIFIWTLLTVWVTYTNIEYTGYVKNRIECKIMKNKLIYLTDEERKCREYLEEVHSRDGNLREILEIAGRSIPNDKVILGGPDVADENYLNKSAGKKFHELSVRELNYRIQTLNKEIQNRLGSANEINKNISYQRMVYCATPNILPCQGHFSRNYGYRIHPISGAYEFHKGIDISNRKGTPICATADGYVSVADWSGGYGKLVVVDHGFGYQTRYGHLSKILVKDGEKIKRGKKIGLMGETGTATCVHLHYEVRYNNIPLNPFTFLKKDVYFSHR
ncbi:MAG: M23 family metallopeptidase [Elusimicrobiota bacterium]